MAQIDLNLGTEANDSTGDSLRAAMQKIQTNTSEIYAKGVTPLFSTLADLPAAADHHGMFAHVHETGAAYFAHAGNWVELQNKGFFTNGANVAISATGEISSTDTQLTDSEIAALGYIKTYTDTQLTDSEIDALGYIKSIADNSVTHNKLENRFTESSTISTLTGNVSFDCSTASVFKLSGDLTGAFTINLSSYKKGQVISVFPLKGQTVTLAAQGSATNTFNKIAESDYDNSVTSLLQIECVDDSATDPVFFYSVATFAADSSI